MGKRTVTIGLVAEDGDANGMKIEDLVRCLEDEKQKIEMFKRELPLCLGFIKHGLFCVLVLFVFPFLS